jgi:UDP-N-acetylmuramate-alanine ligase
VSGGVAPNNPELEAAWDLGIPVYKRSKWLELFTADYSVIAVSGAQGAPHNAVHAPTHW